MQNPKQLDDKTKILLLKGLVIMGCANQIVWFSVTKKFSNLNKRLLKNAQLNHKTVMSFVKHCEDRPDILAAVMKDVEFDVIVKDIDF